MPLITGFVAQRAGLTWALAGLAITPAAVLALLARGGGQGPLESAAGTLP